MENMEEQQQYEMMYGDMGGGAGGNVPGGNPNDYMGGNQAYAGDFDEDFDMEYL